MTAIADCRLRTAESRRAHRRSGVILVAALVLLAGISVVIIALVHEVSLDLKMATSLVEVEQTLEIAKVGIDNILYLVNKDTSWRTNYTSGVWLTDKAVGDGTFTASAIDDDGDLADCPIDSVTAVSTATYKGTKRTLTATLTPPVHDAMMYLAYSSDGARAIEIYNAPRIYGDLCVAERVEIKAGDPPDLRGDIYLPDPSKVTAALDDADTDVIRLASAPTKIAVDYAWFIARGSEMHPPVQDGRYVIADKVISPHSNPCGFANANGIYYILGDYEVAFVRCHITATIVVANGRKVYFENASVHAPAFPHYPAFVSNREVHYSFDQNLSEAESNVDFNLDGDKNDVFTPSVSGVVYSKVRVQGLQSSGGTNLVRFKGALISDRIVLIGSGCIFEQDPALATNLVNQFQGDGLRLVTGSLKIE